MDDAITQGITVPADIDAVWPIVSTPGWWIMDDDGIEPHAIEPDGADAVLVRDPTWGVFRIGVHHHEAPHRAAFTWKPDDGIVPLTVTFTLSRTPDGTDVEVVESGFSEFTPEQHELNDAANVAGWAIALKARATAAQDRR